MSDDAITSALRYQWVTTMPNPRVVSHTADAGQRGWRLHAIDAQASATFAETKHARAVCGSRAAHGWGLDLFIDARCAKCLKKLGIFCTKCGGLDLSCPDCWHGVLRAFLAAEKDARDVASQARAKSQREQYEAVDD